ACMAGDNMAIHAAMRLVRPGEVLVVAAGGHTGVALFGGLLAQSAKARGVAALVTDGAVRDVAELREMGFACFAAGITPAGPHKGFGGTIDGVIACAGCPVAPGDIVLGDDDGIAVVPLGISDRLLAECQAKIAQEDTALARLAKGELLADQMGIPEPELLE
ncbi:MAG: RraA family protein, partial [Xanthomonadales bacterium]|nr:RraA family protein [Xanthomonadales bacterium]